MTVQQMKIISKFEEETQNQLQMLPKKYKMETEQEKVVHPRDFFGTKVNQNVYDARKISTGSKSKIGYDVDGL